MARRGPKSTPTALLVLEGGKRRGGINPAEPKAPKSGPSMPDFLSEAAIEEWNRVVPPLVRMGVISTIDRAAVAAYCVAWGRWEEAERLLKAQRQPDDKDGGFLSKTAAGNTIQNPLLSVATAARRDAVRAAAEIGLTPAARAQLTGEGEGNDEIADRYGI